MRIILLPFSINTITAKYLTCFDKNCITYAYKILMNQQRSLTGIIISVIGSSSTCAHKHQCSNAFHNVLLIEIIRLYIYNIYTYIYIYNRYITTNNHNSINDNNKSNDCFYYNSFNVNDDRKKSYGKNKNRNCYNFLLPKFLPNSKQKIYQKNREGLKYLTKSVLYMYLPEENDLEMRCLS